MKNILLALFSITKKIKDSSFWKGAYIGIGMLCLLILILTGLYFKTGLNQFLMITGMLVSGSLTFVLAWIIGILLHRFINNIPFYAFALVIAGLGVFYLASMARFGMPVKAHLVLIAVFMTGSILFFGFGNMIRTSEKSNWWFWLFAGLGAVAIFTAIYWLSHTGSDPFPVRFNKSEAALLSKSGLHNPGLQGNYAVEYFTYGSGVDKRRKAFADSVRFKTMLVDGSDLIPDWKGSKAKWRKRFWGFDSKHFPLNGRVWMPEGPGTFPMILIVHGNHRMEEYSDPGYAYLGELLASRGFITVSVDENFINGTWSGDFRGKEMPARAWILLEHLKQWREWIQNKDHPLFHKADLDNVILIGHSRGGEAVSIAAAYNTMDHFPDNANVTFDYHFGIKGLVTIAPTDKRYFRRIKLQNINYLSLAGSYDSDESSFFGLRQYQRITYSDTIFHFKSGIYIHGANHGQFNTTWGREDAGPPFSWLLNTEPIIPGNDQRQIAKVSIGAFAEDVLHEQNAYTTFFKNPGSCQDWLPKTLILQNYDDNASKILSNFEEDIDVATGTFPGSRISTKDLNLWNEKPLLFRDSDVQGNSAVEVGWLKKNDSVIVTPSYSIALAAAIPVDTRNSFLISLAPGDFKNLHTKDQDDANENENNKSPLTIRFNIVLEDSLGFQWKVNSDSVLHLAPQLKVQYLKAKGLSTDIFGKEWEPALQSFEIEIKKFSGDGDITNIKQVTLLFDNSSEGVLYLDNIGVR